LEVALVAEELRITQRYLECIEKDDFKALPGVFFYKAFVKQYAQRLGLEPESLVREAERLVEGDKITLLPETARRSAPVVASGAAAAAPALREDPILAEANARIHSQRRFGWSAVALGVVVIACTAFYAWWYQGGTPEVREPLLVEQKPGGLAATDQAAAAAAPPAQGAPATAPLRPQEAGATTAAPMPPLAVQNAAAQDGGDPNGVTINLSATEVTWIEVTSGGKVLFTGLLNPSETRVLRGSDQARMVVGNAGGLSIQFNGKPIGPVGPRGQVRYVQFKKDNYEVLLPNQVVNQ
jgi:cytoskeleton protein RodZ